MDSIEASQKFRAIVLGGVRVFVVLAALGGIIALFSGCGGSVDHRAIKTGVCTGARAIATFVCGDDPPIDQLERFITAGGEDSPDDPDSGGLE